MEAPVIVSFPASQYRALASDDNLAITFDTLAGAAESQQIQVSYIINNKSANKVTGLALVVTDSDAAKLSREEGSEGEIAIPFELEAGGTNDYRFAVDVTSTSPTTALSGGIKYSSGSEDSVAESTLEFSMALPHSTIVFPAACTQDQFAALLTGTSLLGKASTELAKEGMTFAEGLAALCATLHLGVVEATDDVASLYGLTTTQFHLCLLFKANGEGKFVLNAKSSDEEFLAGIMAEVKSIFSA